MDAYIYDAVRTPIGKRNGGLSTTRPDDLAAIPLRAVVERAGIPAEAVEDVVMGCVTQIGEQGFNIGRIAALIAGYPVTVCGTSVNRQCGSSLQALNFAAGMVASGQHDFVVASGVESMSRVAMGSDGGSMSEQLLDHYDIIPQGLSAEMIAKRWNLSRGELDAFALRSHERALHATDQGYFEREIVRVDAKAPDGTPFAVTSDEGPRRGGSLEKLGALKPAFKSDGVVTAATSSQISDGAAAALIGSRAAGEKFGIKPRAKIVTTALAGIEPTIMLTGVIPATQKVLKKAGLTMEDIGLFEVNEAFASVVMSWAKDMGADFEKVNVNGGACALGHPLGASGVRLMTTLLHEMERRDVRYGLATLCIGFGQAVATIIDRNVN
jgi:acetyl-CoA acetyltransferase family protein